MATTGVMLRRGLQADLISNPPIVGELVYATDLGMHGWLDETSTLVWKKINEVVEVPEAGGGSSTLVSSKQTNSNYYDDEILIAEWDYVDAEVTLKVDVNLYLSTDDLDERLSVHGFMTFGASEVGRSDGYASNTNNTMSYRVASDGDVERGYGDVRCFKDGDKTKVYITISSFSVNRGTCDTACSVFDTNETTSGFSSREFPGGG